METSKENGKRCAGPGIQRLILILLFAAIIILPSAHASFGEEYQGAGAEQYNTMGGEEKFKEVFYSEGEGGTAQSIFVNETWNDYEPWGWSYMCMFAVLLSAFIYGTIYILGKALGATSIEKFALSELFQTAATAVMVIALVGLIVGAFDFISNAFGGTIQCQNTEIADPLQGDMCRTDEMLQSVNQKYLYVLSADYEEEMLYSLVLSSFGYPWYMGSMNAAVHKKVETYHYIAHACVEMMIFLSSKMFLLKYIQQNMLQFFLPLGLILRSFHFTRGIGAFFMAMAIGFYFVYPTIVFIMDSSYTASSGPAMPSIITTGMCNMPMFGSFSFGSAALESSSTAGIASGMAMSNSLSTFLAQLYTHFFYSNMVAFAVAITFIRFATTILGGDISPFMGMVGKLV